MGEKQYRLKHTKQCHKMAADGKEDADHDAESHGSDGATFAMGASRADGP